MIRVLIIGGYGNFGGTIARRLALNPNIQLLISGRHIEKARLFCNGLDSKNEAISVELDIDSNLSDVLEKNKPHLVIHTSGPFQGQGYNVPMTCIQHKIHYCDLSDGREFVKNIGDLDTLAKERGVFVITGASSVPSLTSAILDDLVEKGIQVAEVDAGIATAQQTRLGLATTAATLSYAGRPIKTLVDGLFQSVYGWQNIHSEQYPILGRRLMANVDVPDLAIFPERYPSLKTYRFYAGVEVQILQFGVWVLSWLAHFRMIPTPNKFYRFLAKSAGIFDFLGTNSSGFHMKVKGMGKEGDLKQVAFYVIARQGHGPNIPCAPCVWIAENLAKGECLPSGAYPCVGIIKLAEYLDMFKGLDVQYFWREI